MEQIFLVIIKSQVTAFVRLLVPYVFNHIWNHIWPKRTFSN